ncbi:MAG: hypothetical protein IKB60_01470 [Clostridia bacterium]|nr:hypothetical protein [Clostridia bacterium]
MERYMIIDNRYKEAAQKEWGNLYEIIPSVTSKKLSEPVSAHPDMVLFKTGKDEFICAPDVFCEYKEILEPKGAKIICGKKELSCNYPKDIAYNVFKADTFALAKWQETDKEIIKHLEKENIKMIDIKQGYSKCSVCGFSGGIITADSGICKVAKRIGTDALEIPSGEILLSGYDYGFIGGASGVNEKGELFFFGDLDSLSYGKEIKRFLIERKIKFFEIKDYPLTDVGTIMFF